MKKRIVSIALSVVLIVSVCSIPLITVFGGSAEDDLTALYNATNTFDYNAEHTAYSSKYFMDERNGNAVDGGDAIVTFLVSGRAGTPGHFVGEGGDFVYSERSLITRMAGAKPCNFYWAKTDGEGSYELSDVTSEVYGGIEGEFEGYYQGVEISAITDFSRHSVVLFDSADFKDLNGEDAYTEFNYVVSNVLYGIKNANGGVLPKINVLGYCMGGNVVMRYALDHPDLIDTLLCLSSPLMGTTMGSIDCNLLGSTSGAFESEYYLIDRDVYLNMFNRWNDNYDALYSNINAVAIGAYSSLELVKDSVLDRRMKDSLVGGGMDQETADSIQKGVSYVIDAVEIAMKAMYASPLGITKAGKARLALGVLSEIMTNFEQTDEAYVELLQLLTNEIFYDYANRDVAVFGDGLVDLGSQLGYEGMVPLDGKVYKGFKRQVKYFTRENSDFEAMCSDRLVFVHTLVSNDAEVNEMVIDDLTFGYKG